MTWQQRYMDRFYDRRRGWQDGNTQFHALCERFIPAGSRILEVGAGPGNATSEFLARRGELHGVDPDPDVKSNPYLKTAATIEGDVYPFEDGFFDACVSNYVVEHVEEPEKHLAEIRRVLRPGGVYLFRSPNRFHYVAIVSSLTPHWFHEAVANRLRNRGPDAHAPYPTVYAMNTPARLKRVAAGAGLDIVSIDMVEKEPSYGMASRLMFLSFMVYERIVNASSLGEPLRANLFAVLQKPT